MKPSAHFNHGPIDNALAEEPVMKSRYPPRQLNKLCDGCQAVFPTTGPWFWDLEDAVLADEDDWHLRDFSICDLHESAGAGCHLCRVFLDSLLPPDMIVGNRQGYVEWYEANQKIRLRCSLDKDWKNVDLPMKLTILSNYQEQSTLGERFATSSVQTLRFQSVRPALSGQCTNGPAWIADIRDFLGSSSGYGPLTISQPTSTTTFGSSSIEQVRKWSTQCLEDHGNCILTFSSGNEKHRYQSKIRFVDVGTDEHPIFRLVDGETLKRQEGCINYITLSYRWTAETALTSLRTYNKALYHDPIPTETLPQIYKDAAAVARALHIPYVWIDSLCIIQDSTQDWNEQASLMDSIYTHARLNLSGMFADRAVGLRVERDPLAVSPCIISRRLPTDCDADEEWYEHFACFEGYGANSFVDLAPLFRRAWCHQERVLPIRTVYFGEQLVWQCPRQMASEAFPSWIWRGPYDPFSEMSVHAHRQQALDIGYLLLEDSRDTWENIVKLYTQTQVTKQTDRLVALRGIFNRFGHMWGQHDLNWCVAGLWKQHLVRQLLWERCGEMNKEDEDMTARAKEILDLFPSWSWASCPSEIFFQTMGLGRGHHVEDLVEVDSIQPSRPLKSGDTYTAFETGSHIVFRGLIAQQFDPEKVLQTWTTQDSLDGLEVSLSIDGERTLKLDTGVVFDRPQIDSIKHEDLRFLPLRMYCMMNDSCSGYVGGLLVESLGIRDGLPTYRRMGLFSAFCETEIIPGWLDRAEELAENIDVAMGDLRDKRKEFPLLQLV
ncbi:HET-domain-containing protein [Neurospora crassa]|uniref:Heterokaryon incompatibility domain-containing protein n=1 Tax=Neurospora crassa (strain ATCC 24698 / 74-OR23-1A / CBS 708.71 / DSM 1257 / FGSC 987) TaxID=367110 RepID=V5IKT4_NEUCR|nr:hypothetical protein NCU17062 [Neurospora crassa OR74A]ESA42112.1 hypothetical protein NCU17062 [Neurospora crassa OR74A]KHE86875.1 HET-domain-containing protein [Neurospora crassa]|eukprot:XP_011395076.1 hypothetical protein NCU17062 [Neurospora crassa OR74A]